MRKKHTLFLFIPPGSLKPQDLGGQQCSVVKCLSAGSKAVPCQRNPLLETTPVAISQAARHILTEEV